jgi:hypothetical protein
MLLLHYCNCRREQNVSNTIELVNQLPDEVEDLIHQGHVQDEADNGIICNYKKCGFVEEFTRINKKNPKLSKTFFVKYFDEEDQFQGVLKDSK